MGGQPSASQRGRGRGVTIPSRGRGTMAPQNYGGFGSGNNAGFGGMGYPNDDYGMEDQYDMDGFGA